MNPRPPFFQSGTPRDLIEFFERWASLRKDGAIPLLRDYLDTAPVRLQPNVVIVEVHSSTAMTVRLFGTGLERTSGLYPTAQPLMNLYAEAIRDTASQLVWITVTHPVGYICIRHVRTTGGHMVDCPAIGLPLKLDTAEPHCFITYANLDNARQAMARDEGLEAVQDIEFVQWIDIGNGAPPVLSAKPR